MSLLATCSPHSVGGTPNYAIFFLSYYIKLLDIFNSYRRCFQALSKQYVAVISDYLYSTYTPTNTIFLAFSVL